MVTRNHQIIILPPRGNTFPA